MKKEVKSVKSLKGCHPHRAIEVAFGFCCDRHASSGFKADESELTREELMEICRDMANNGGY